MDRSAYLSPGRPVVELKIGDTVIEATAHLETFSSVVYAGGSAAKTSITLYDPEYDLIEAMLKKLSKTSQTKDPTFIPVSHRYGWVNGQMSPWRKGILSSYRPRLAEQGVHIDLTTTDFTAVYGLRQEGKVWDLTKDLGTQSVGETAATTGTVPTISGLVKLLAALMGFPYDSTTIVETQPTERTLIGQHNYSIPEFIQYVLCPLAISTNGDGDYRFWIDDHGRLNFRPAILSAPKYHYIVGRTSSEYDSEVISFVPSFDGMRTLADGAGACTATGYNPLDGSLLSGVADEPVNDGTTATLTTPTIHFPSETGRLYTLPYADDASLAAWRTAKTTAARLRFVSADMTVIGRTDISPLDVVHITVLKRGSPNDPLSFYTGDYLVQGVEQTIRNGMFTTSLKLSSPAFSAAAEAPAATTTTSPQSPGSTVQSVPE